MSYTSRHAADVPDDLLVAAREWAADDPDPVTRDELLAIVAAAEGAVLRRDEGATKGGDPAAIADLADRLALLHDGSVTAAMLGEVRTTAMTARSMAELILGMITETA